MILTSRDAPGRYAGAAAEKSADWGCSAFRLGEGRGGSGAEDRFRGSKAKENRSPKILGAAITRRGVINDLELSVTHGSLVAGVALVLVCTLIFFFPFLFTLRSSRLLALLRDRNETCPLTRKPILHPHPDTLPLHPLPKRSCVLLLVNTILPTVQVPIAFLKFLQNLPSRKLVDRMPPLWNCLDGNLELKFVA